MWEELERKTKEESRAQKEPRKHMAKIAGLYGKQKLGKGEGGSGAGEV